MTTLQPLLPGRPARELAAPAAPTGTYPELVARAWSSALLVAVVAAVVFPGWAVVDSVLEPAVAAPFVTARLLIEVPIARCAWLLWRHPLGRRQPAALAFAVLALVQLCTAGMLVQVEHVELYLLGFTVALQGGGLLLVVRPRWTVALVAVSYLGVVLAALTAPRPVPTDTLVGVLVFLTTASVVAVLAHTRRWELAVREAGTRARLEEEQQRTRELLVELDRLSHEDALTGLANRRRWDTALAAACAAAQSDGGRVAVVLVDLDRFKQVNDRLGHAAGDAALQAVAALVRGRVRTGDLAARLGGDELALLLPGSGLPEAVGLAERVRRDSLELLPAGYAEPGVSLSIGVAVAVGADARAPVLLAAADAQLYLAKANRNAVRPAALV